MKISDRYHAVKTLPMILCPECGTGMAYIDMGSKIMTVSCLVDTCVCFKQEFAVSDLPVVTLHHLGEVKT